MNVKFIITALTCLSPALLSAQTQMTVNPATDITEQWGTSRTERYDVAFRLSDSSLSGSEINGITIPFAADSAITDCCIWLSNELQLEGGENKPDIIQIAVEPEADALSAVLSEPVTIPEEGCYVGFSFTVSELNDYSKSPVTVSPTSQPGEMYVHTSRRFLKWGTQNLSLTPDIAITLSGDFHPDAVAVISLPEAGSLRNEPVATTAVLRNHGLNKVRSIDYRIDINDNSFTRHVNFDTPLPTHYFADVPMIIELDSDLAAGAYPMTFTLTKVNDIENEDLVCDANSHLFIYPYLPERIPLMEEYTGTWCGWCPRGIVGMERMSELCPDKFIYAAYHREKDPMATVEEVVTPYVGAPSGYLDRVLAVDPYNGTSPVTVATAMEGIGAAWQERCQATTTGEISATARWSETDNDIINIDTKTVFVRDYYSPCFAIGYILTADGLCGETAEWIQSNYFSGEETYADTELIEFVEQPAHIADMIYNGVVVMATPLTGVDGSFPDTIEMESSLSHSFTFNLKDAVNYLGEPLPIDKRKVKVIACIVDNLTGEIVNCTQCPVTDEAAAESLGVDQLNIAINEDGILLSGINGNAKVVLHTASGILIDRASGENELIVSKPSAHGVYILTVNGISRKIML